MTTKRLLSLAATALMMLGMVSLAMAGIPDETVSTATSGSGCLRVVPDGTGETLSAKGLTVTVTVLDTGGLPVVAYPFQDVGLADNAGGADVSLCTSGWVSSANTNSSGVTTITGVGFGGGNTQGGMRATVGGVRITNGLALDIDVVSSDLNGDLIVNLTDLSSVALPGFAPLYKNGVYDWQSDLNCDLIENLLDVTKFANDNGSFCP